MNDSPPTQATFEEALHELDRIVRDLEDGQIGLEESLGRYEQGVALLKRCYAQLREAEQRILQLTGVDEEGQPTLQPFQHAATTDNKAVPRRGPRRADEPRGSTY